MKTEMPVLFIGHGSPMNIIENNYYTKEWEDIVQKFPEPKGILSISAHWYTDGSFVTAQKQPKQIYDFYGFPKELYQIQYQLIGNPKLAGEMNALENTIEMVDAHGIDHGTWCPLSKMYSNANIPTVQLSVNGAINLKQSIQMGKKIKSLRKEGYLILGSGDVVHNLALTDFDKEDGYPWAYQFDEYIKNALLDRDDEKLVDYQQQNSGYENAFKSLEHYLPLLYAYGATEEDEIPHIFAEGCTLGSISMTCYAWGL